MWEFYVSVCFQYVTLYSLIVLFFALYFNRLVLKILWLRWSQRICSHQLHHLIKTWKFCNGMCLKRNQEFGVLQILLKMALWITLTLQKILLTTCGIQQGLWITYFYCFSHSILLPPSHFWLLKSKWHGFQFQWKCCLSVLKGVNWG